MNNPQLRLRRILRVCRYFVVGVSAAESQLLNISSNEFSGSILFMSGKWFKTFVQKASHLQDQCFPLQKQAYNSSGSQIVHVGVFRQTGRMKWSLDNSGNLPASWEKGWRSVIPLDRIFIGNRDSVCMWLLWGWNQQVLTVNWPIKSWLSRAGAKHSQLSFIAVINCKIFV